MVMWRLFDEGGTDALKKFLHARVEPRTLRNLRLTHPVRLRGQAEPRREFPDAKPTASLGVGHRNRGVDRRFRHLFRAALDAIDRSARCATHRDAGRTGRKRPSARHNPDRTCRCSRHWRRFLGTTHGRRLELIAHCALIRSADMRLSDAQQRVFGLNIAMRRRATIDG
jgi:hypothetical protein